MADTTRMKQLLDKLDHPKNVYARNRMPQWLEDSKAYAQMMLAKHNPNGLTENYFRALYVCNHLCPNLVHLRSKPIPPAPSYVRREPEAMREYQDLLFQYEYENSQVAIAQNGEIIQPGCHHTDEEFALIMEYVERMCAA